MQAHTGFVALAVSAVLAGTTADINAAFGGVLNVSTVNGADEFDAARSACGKPGGGLECLCGVPVLTQIFGTPLPGLYITAVSHCFRGALMVRLGRFDSPSIRRPLTQPAATRTIRR